MNPYKYSAMCPYCLGDTRHCGGWGKCEVVMPRYTVDVFTKEIKTHVVEAETPDEAEEKALEGLGDVVGVRPMDEWIVDSAKEIEE